MKERIINFLRWTQNHTKTDMVYVVSGGFWWMTGKVGLFLISFATMAAFARWLPKEGYGTYQFVLSGLALLSIFTLPGVNTAIVKSIAQKKRGNARPGDKRKNEMGTFGLSFVSGSGWLVFLARQ